MKQNIHFKFALDANKSHLNAKIEETSMHGYININQ